MLGAIGGLLLLIGVIWMVVTAIQTGQTTGDKAIWALVCFFCGVLGGIIFFAVKRQGLVPLLLEIIGCVLMFLGGGFNYSYNMGGPVTP
jgi:peptidoglycan/LPS O-acetylase OafA/YrhL